MTMTHNITLTTKHRCHILSDNGLNPNGVPSYSPGLPESARATLGFGSLINTTLKGLHNTTVTT